MNRNKIFSLISKKDRFEIYLFGFRIVLRRYFRMIREIFLMAHYGLLKETLKTQFNVCLPKEAYHHLSGDVELVYVALRDIQVPCGHHKVCPITETIPYKWLANGKTGVYSNSIREGNVYVYDQQLAKDRMIRMEKEIINGKGYDPAICVVCLRKNNYLIDGAHRCAALYLKYGGDHKILVVREK